MIELQATEGEEFTIVEISIPETIHPEDIRKVEPPQVNPRKGVVLTGRAPIWLYSFLVHQYHPTRWIACNDPRLGAVVVASHHPEAPKVGEVVDIPPF